MVLSMPGQYPSFGILRFIYHLPNFVKLVWRLFRDPRVPVHKKILPSIAGMICLAYLVIPVDVLPDFLSFIGHLDDLTVIALIMVPSIWVFVRTCPKDVVKDLSHKISMGE
jgi:uncharacterized membrane protein YkvA (DUF1232 family)